MARPIYVEIAIRTTLDALWDATQAPAAHARWDLRFSDIEYLPPRSEGEPQRFLYATRIGFGLRVSGTGETVPGRESPSERTSALRFASNDPKSLILEGAGYWRYIERETDVRFLTQYDYRTRWGIAGRLVDRIFRPVLGWATAWSFDRLRLWLERGIDPAVSLQRAIGHGVARLTLAVTWVYQGLVPKLLVPDSGELTILRGAGLPSGPARWALTGIGWAEVAFGAILLVCWTSRLPDVVNLAFLFLLAIGALISRPALFLAPFNPLTLTLAMSALSVIALAANRDLPSARNCRRRRPEREA